MMTPSGLLALAAGGAPILGVVGFATGRPAGLPASCPFLELPLPPLSAACLEVWIAERLVTQPVMRQDRDGVALAGGGGLLLGIASVREADHDGIADLARSLYGRIFRSITDAGCPTLLRVFNYLPRICEAGSEPSALGLTGFRGERYHAFNVGRHEAFAASGRALAAAPAASAVGIPEHPLGDGAPGSVPCQGTVHAYFLASDRTATPVENARQVSAYAYPPRYGPRSPTFSRATIAHLPDGAFLFVSGTASIVGHESRHLGDPAGQTDEVLRNLDAVLEGCRLRGFVLAEPLRLKVYLRRPSDVGAVAGRLSDAGFEAVFLRADICRPELLVEIEAVARLDGPVP